MTGNPESDVEDRSHGNAGRLVATWKRVTVPALIVGGALLGDYLGKIAGRGWDGFGRIAGERVGAWLGFGIGLAIGAVLAGLVSRQLYVSDSAPPGRPMLIAAVVSLTAMLSCLAAVAGEAVMGEGGGPL